MGITAATVSTYAVNETLGDQAQQSGNNQIILSDDIQAITGNNGQVTGTDYVDRLIVVNLGGTEQTRYVITDAAGTGATRILTVSEDWDTNPAQNGTVHVFYDMEDLDGVVSEYNTRTGFYEMTNPIIVGNGTDVAGLFMGNGDLVEIEDSKSATVYSLETQNNGRLQCGYLLGGIPVAGAYITGINNSQGEGWVIFESGSEGRIYDTRMIASLNPLQLNCASGSDVQADGFSIFQGTDEGLYFGAALKNGSITGAATATEIIRLDASSLFDVVAVIGTDGLYTADADTSTETIGIKNTVFIGNNNYIVLVNNKTWNVDNPTWAVTSHTDIEDTAVTGTAAVNDRRTIDTVVQEADGTKLQNALVNVYENTQLADLVLESTTDVNGVASGAFNYRAMSWTTGTGSTITYGGHALQAGKWLYSPFVAAQASSDFFNGTIVLSSDNNIVQTTQATALSDGAGITWNDDTNPSSVIAFTAGSGGTIGLAVGDTITGGTSSATGIVTDIIDGDGTAGTVHLKTRSATNFSDGETLDNGADGWTATYTAASQQDFAVWIGGNSKSYQIIYDYLSAKQTETTLSTDGELIWEWCRSAQSQPLYASGASFYTEQSNSKGVIIVNTGAGTVDYFTDDTGGTWTPPSSVTLTVNVENQGGNPVSGARVRIEKSSNGSLIAQGSTNASGVFTAAYTYTTDVAVLTKVRLKSYRFFRTAGTIGSTGLTVGATVQKNTIVDLP